MKRKLSPQVILVGVVAVAVVAVAVIWLSSRGSGRAASLAGKYVPDTVTVVAGADVRAIRASKLWKDNEALVVAGLDAAGMEQARQKFGFQLDTLDAVACGFHTGRKAGGCVLSGGFDRDKLRAALTELGQPVKADGAEIFSGLAGAVALVESDVTVVGSPDFVSAALRVSRGEERSIMQNDAIQTMRKSVDPDAHVWVASVSSELGDVLEEVARRDVGVRGGALSLSVDERLDVRAVVELVSAAEADDVRDALREQWAKALKKSKDFDISTVVEGLAIESSGSMVRVSTRVNSALTAVIAVPAFVKYQRRAKTTEAIDELDKIYKGAAFYYTKPQIAADGTKLPCQFPAPAPITPEGSPCDHPDQRFPGDPTVWLDHPSWEALTFQMNGPHYFRYAYDSQGTLEAATMTASAYGDLDCDGEWSTFQRIGWGDPQATRVECSMYGSAAFFVDNETE